MTPDPAQARMDDIAMDRAEARAQFMATLTTIPAHTFEAATRINPDGTTAKDERCGYLHRVDDGRGVFCEALEGHSNHHGLDRQVRVHEWAEEDER